MHKILNFCVQCRTNQFCPSNTLSFITVSNEIAKVMFLHLSVCPQGGVCLGACWDSTSPPEQTPQEHTPWEQTLPWRRPPEETPPSRWLLQRTVRILLECILVILMRSFPRVYWFLFDSAPSPRLPTIRLIYRYIKSKKREIYLFDQ